MADMEISLQMPAGLGAIVTATNDVQTALQRNQHVHVRPMSIDQDASGAFRDFGATAIAILGTASAAAAIKGLFEVIKTAVIEAHKTHRQKMTQEHELKKLFLAIGKREIELDLDNDIQAITECLGGLEQEMVAAVEGG